MNISKFGSIIYSLLQQGYELNVRKVVGIVHIEARKDIETRIIHVYPDGEMEEYMYIKTAVPLPEVPKYVANGYFPEDLNLIRLMHGADHVIVMGRVFRIEPMEREIEEAVKILCDIIEIYGGVAKDYTVVMSKKVKG